jgi:hypothetical protein
MRKEQKRTTTTWNYAIEPLFKSIHLKFLNFKNTQAFNIGDLTYLMTMQTPAK